MTVLKKLLLFLLFTAAPAHSEEILSVSTCDVSSLIYEYLAKEYQETPLFTGVGSSTLINRLGQSYSTTYELTVTVNQTTGTWSVIADMNTGISCLLSTGGLFTPK